MVSQPEPLDIFWEERWTTWTPDFLIERTAGPRELVEVKPLDQARPTDPIKAARAAARFEACRVAARKAGYLFRLATEQEIRVQPLLFNSKLILRHTGPFFDRGLILKAMLALPTLPSTPIVKDLGSAIGNPGAALEIAIRLDRLGHIRINRSEKFSKLSTFCVLSARE